MLAARPTSTTPSSPGSASTSSRAAGCASAAPTASANAGAQVALRVGTTGVLVVRGDDGELRGFANICRHRGHELLRAAARRPPAASSSARTTPGATSSTGGCALAPRYRRRRRAFEPAAFGLVAGPGRRRGRGWVFVNVSGQAPPLAERRGHAGRRRRARTSATGSWRPPRHRYELARPTGSSPHENYQECYHCPLIHPELCRVSPPQSGDNLRPVRGAWVGGAMDLAAARPRCRSTGGPAVSPLRGLVARAAPAGALRRALPEPAAQPPPGLRPDPPARAGEHRPRRRSSASGCSRPRRSSGRTSTRPTPSTSGT